MDTTLKAVDEFHKAFGIKCPDKPIIEELDKGFTLAYLTHTAVVLKSLAKELHTWCEQNDKSTPLLRMQLIVEEAGEFAEAMAKNDIANALHELADLRYVVDGSALSLGLGEIYIDAFNEIHRANMSKLDAQGKPVVNGAGRVIKSDQFKPANVAPLLGLERGSIVVTHANKVGTRNKILAGNLESANVAAKKQEWKRRDWDYITERMQILGHRYEKLYLTHDAHLAKNYKIIIAEATAQKMEIIRL